MENIKSWIKLMRIKHWVKNGIIFLPMFFGKKFDRLTIQRSAAAYIAFCFLASAIYVFNDIADVENDRKHPIKCKRPIASGEINIPAALAGHCVLICLGIFLFICIGRAEYLFPSLALYAAYYIINIIYTLKGKKIPLLDIVILSGGFLIRLFYGSMVTGIVISEWLYLVIMSGAFYLGLSKRRNEMVHQSKKDIEQGSRSVLKYYTYQFLDKNMYLCLTLTIVFYTLWCTGHLEKERYLLFTIPLVLVIAMKYNLNIEKDDADGDPTDTILGDKVLLLLVMLLVLAMFLILYIL